MESNVLLQYGALGVIALLALAAVRLLFQREVKAHDAETERANKAEEELRRLNEAVRNQYITVLTEATTAISETLQVIRDIKSAYSEDKSSPKRRRR